VPHGLTLYKTVYVLDTPSALKLNGMYTVASIIDSTHFTITLASGAQAAENVAGSFFTSDDGGSAYPDGWDKFLTFSRTDSLQFSGGGISLSAGGAQAPAINFGVNGDRDTGIFQPGVGSVGIAIDGSLVAKFDSDGIDVTSGTDDHPGYGFSGDANEDTGIYRKSEDTIGVATGGHERMTISNSGITFGEPERFARTVIVQGETTTAASTELTIDGASPGSDNRIIIPDNKTVAVTITILGRNTTNGNGRMQIRAAIVKRVSGTQSLVGGIVQNVMPPIEDTGTSTWTGTVDASSSGFLRVLVTGAAATTIRWTAKVELVEAD